MVLGACGDITGWNQFGYSPPSYSIFYSACAGVAAERRLCLFLRDEVSCVSGAGDGAGAGCSVWGWRCSLLQWRGAGFCPLEDVAQGQALEYCLPPAVLMPPLFAVTLSHFFMLSAFYCFSCCHRPLSFAPMRVCLFLFCAQKEKEEVRKQWFD